MACTMCEDADNKGDKYYYRWGVANVVVIGCTNHVKEIFEVLSKYQSDLMIYNQGKNSIK